MINVYGMDRVYQEAAFIGYYFHWGRDEIMRLSHLERIRWCEEISKINNELSGGPDNIFQIDGPDRKVG